MDLIKSIWLQLVEIYGIFTWKEWLLYITIVIIGFLVIRALLRYWHRRHEKTELVHMRVTLPKSDSKLDQEKRTEKDFREAIGKAEQLFRALHETRELNLYNIIFKRTLWRKPQLAFELQFEKRQLNFAIVCDPYYQKIVDKQITSFYQAAEIEILKPEQYFDLKPKDFYANGYYMYTEKPHWYPIQTYKKIEDDALNDLANSFAKLSMEEKAVIQFVIHPKSKKWQKQAEKISTRLYKEKKEPSGIFSIPIIGFLLRILFLPIKILVSGYDPKTDTLTGEAEDSGGMVRMLSSKEEVYKSMGEKSAQSGYDTTIRVLAASPEKDRVEEILNGIFVAFNVFKAKGSNTFENQRIIPLNFINSPLIQHNYRLRLPSFFEKKCLLCSEELATLFHFPDSRYNRIPTIAWLTYKMLPPPIDLPKEGVVLGNSIYRGIVKPVRFMRDDRTRHQYCIGKSGSGKSVLLWNMAVQDIKNGDGVCVIDPHGDLVDDIVNCIPKERAKDVVIFDPGDLERPMGLNILDAKTAEEKDRASLDAMEIFIKLFGNEVFGPRIQHYFRNGCLTLMDDVDEGATLIDIPRLFIDDDYQKYKVSKVQNVMVRAFWENEMANTGEREKQEMIPYFTSKFGPFITNTTMRNIIGQTKSSFNVRNLMDSQKILMVNLSKGKIGEINAQLLGLIMVARINMAAMGRYNIPKEERKDFFFYVDEFQNFATDTFAAILSEARKYRLCLIMAHQYIAQLTEGSGGGGGDTKIRDAVFGNVGSMMSFKVGADDAEYLEKEYSPALSAQDILSIANYKAYVKLNINNTTSSPFSMQTLYDPSMKNEAVGEVIKKYSRMKFGRKKEFVDAEIEARMGVGQGAGGGAGAPAAGKVDMMAQMQAGAPPAGGPAPAQSPPQSAPAAPPPPAPDSAPAQDSAAPQAEEAPPTTPPTPSEEETSPVASPDEENIKREV